MLLIQYPRVNSEKYKYAIDIIFGEFLSIPYSSTKFDGSIITISALGKELTVATGFLEELFGTAEFSLSSLNNLEKWDSRSTELNISLVDEHVHVLFGTPKVVIKNDKIEIGFDVFGATFFMLSRYEEYIAKEHDSFGRFQAKSSVAFRCGFLSRPLIDEYVEILWSFMNKLWPQLERKKKIFRIIPTHDVDNPFLNYMMPDIAGFLRRLASDIFKRKSLRLFSLSLTGWLNYRFKGIVRFQQDPFNTFDKLMTLSEEKGLKSYFYFMTNKETENQFSGRYNIDDHNILALVQEIWKRGHEIGFHPTGDSNYNERSFSKQARMLFEVGKNIGFQPKGGRQHYLLWSIGQSEMFWEQNGFSYESTMGYGEYAGFRCGTCKEYSLWNNHTESKMKLKERPLILMESSLFSDSMNLSRGQAIDLIKQLKDACEVVGGNFVFLWHNCQFLDRSRWEVYKECIKVS